MTLVFDRFGMASVWRIQAVGSLMVGMVCIALTCHVAVGQSPNASLHVVHGKESLTILPTYALPDTATGNTTALHYELTVERTGTSTARSRQGGSFTPTPCRVDTLSTVRLNAQPGDRLSLHLTIRRHARIVESVRRDTTLSPSE